ncbi:MAG TPA: CBS domain-containing protein [Gaiellaceae bacterium]|nr:CBS domain-containing protein [Gaiellaceae bacterium]
MSVRLVSVAPDESVQAAIARMVEADVGSVAVCEGARLAGIFTERDVLRLAGERAPLDELLVRDAMTTPVQTVSGDDDILAAARIMGERAIRHLPVVQGDNVLGIVGIRDVLGALTERLWRTHDEQARETVRELLGRRR